MQTGFSVGSVGRLLELGVVLGAASFAGAVADERQADLADRLGRSERLVASGHAKVHYQCIPTAGKEFKRIEAASRNRGDAEDVWRRYITNEQMAAEHTTDVEWWRKGEMERVDVYQHASSPAERRLVRSTGFDGSVVRSINVGNDGTTIGNLENVDGGGLSNTNREWPFSFLHEFQMTPYSDIVRRSPEYDESYVERDGARYRQVRVRHPDIDFVAFELTFDEDHRLTERRIYWQLTSYGEEEPQCRLHQEFGDYRLVECADGNTVWFPHEVVNHNYVGPLLDGEPVEWQTKRVTVEEIEFNIDIPDETFQVPFPPGIRVYDGLTGLGWIADKDAFASDVAAELAGTLVDVFEDPAIVHPPTSSADNAAGAKVADQGPPPTVPRRSGARSFLGISLVGIACAGVLCAAVWRRRRIRLKQ